MDMSYKILSLVSLQNCVPKCVVNSISRTFPVVCMESWGAHSISMVIDVLTAILSQSWPSINSSARRIRHS